MKNWFQHMQKTFGEILAITAEKRLLLSSSEEFPPNKIVKRREWAKKYRQMDHFHLDADGELWFNSM